MQKSWLYLEPVFTSEDILRQLLVEGKRYQTMNRVADPNVCVCVCVCVCWAGGVWVLGGWVVRCGGWGCVGMYICVDIFA